MQQRGRPEPAPFDADMLRQQLEREIHVAALLAGGAPEPQGFAPQTQQQLQLQQLQQLLVQTQAAMEAQQQQVQQGGQGQQPQPAAQPQQAEARPAQAPQVVAVAVAAEARFVQPSPRRFQQGGLNRVPSNGNINLQVIETKHEGLEADLIRALHSQQHCDIAFVLANDWHAQMSATAIGAHRCVVSVRCPLLLEKKYACPVCAQRRKRGVYRKCHQCMLDDKLKTRQPDPDMPFLPQPMEEKVPFSEPVAQEDDSDADSSVMGVSGAIREDGERIRPEPLGLDEVHPDDQTAEVIELRDLDYTTLVQLLEFCYTDTVQDLLANTITLKQMFSLATAANKYNLVRLESMCCDSLGKLLSVDNVAVVLKLVLDCRLTSLKRICYEFMRDNFDMCLCQNAAFLHSLPKVEFQQIMQLKLRKHIVESLPKRLPVPPPTLAADMRTLFERRKVADCDFCIRFGKHEVWAHKAVVSCRSGVFGAMIRSGMKDSSETVLTQQPEPTPSAVRTLLRYMYCGDTEISADDAVYLLGAADFYDIPNGSEFENACQIACMSNVTRHNFLPFLLNARDTVRVCA